MDTTIKSRRFRRTIPVGVLGLTIGCVTEFDYTIVEGTWSTSAIRLSTDECQIEEALVASLSQQTYVMGAVSEDDEDNQNTNSNISESMIAMAQANIWNACETYDGPDFSCNLPLPVLHLEEWVSALEPLVSNDGAAGNCAEGISVSAIEGSSDGLFLDEQTAFVSGWIAVQCRDIEIDCETSFGIDLRR